MLTIMLIKTAEPLTDILFRGSFLLYYPFSLLANLLNKNSNVCYK